MQGIVWTAVMAVCAVIGSVLVGLAAYLSGDPLLMGLAAVVALCALALAVLAWRAP